MAGDAVGIDHRPNAIPAGSSSLAWRCNLVCADCCAATNIRAKAIRIKRLIGLWRVLGPGGLKSRFFAGLQSELEPTKAHVKLAAPGIFGV